MGCLVFAYKSLTIMSEEKNIPGNETVLESYFLKEIQYTINQ